MENKKRIAVRDGWSRKYVHNENITLYSLYNIMVLLKSIKIANDFPTCFFDYEFRMIFKLLNILYILRRIVYMYISVHLFCTPK